MVAFNPQLASQQFQAARLQQLQTELTQAGITNVTAQQLDTQVKQSFQAQPPGPSGPGQIMIALNNALSADGVSQTQISAFDAQREEAIQQRQQQQQAEQAQGLQTRLAQAGITNINTLRVVSDMQQTLQGQTQKTPDSFQTALDGALLKNGATQAQVTALDAQHQQEVQQRQQQQAQVFQTALNQAGLSNLNAQQVMSQVKQVLQSQPSNSPGQFQAALNTVLQQDGASQTQIDSLNTQMQQTKGLHGGHRKKGPGPAGVNNDQQQLTDLISQAQALGVDTNSISTSGGQGQNIQTILQQLEAMIEAKQNLA